ncbi:DHA2 family efflux MFS transporter permease subunit [Nocardia huaxiensis]|uniref:DHA2 family efflux MFS transporter permease subunit n=1 Tax=Nocardia huaxiensis TaxID=2755382 RepID=A0A7D6ZCW8_9NOCA|nr:DHA2 family efflux MFS transporter permease subunit [Nocardia huaxiensis]QLY32448.1 DHA2 family efflux MFS transporter permease subunit [Nocardia huaxiensis]UFS93847.1 DHA2 family efflux MFS transporter permease subunit [Nocardia huaxiensis]
MTEAELEAAVPMGRKKWFALGVLALGLSMVVLDGTIVSVSLPVIIGDLDLNFTQAQWITSIYAVVLAALLITSGRLGDRLGRRNMFALGVLVFLAGSVLAAMATSIWPLILGRVVQGIGAAGVMPGTLATMNAIFRGRDRIIAFAVWGSVISGVAAIGPLLGGWITTYYTWPWIFLVNIPLGVLVLIGLILFVPETRMGKAAPGLDVDGFLLSAAGFALLVFALIEGQTYGWWKPLHEFPLAGWTWPVTAPISPIPVLLALGVLCLVLFIRWEQHRNLIGRSALLDPALFKIKSFRWGNITAFAVALGEFGLLFVLPLFMVNVLGLSTLGAGYVLAAMAVGAFLAAGIAEGLVHKFGPVRVVQIGLAIEAVAIALAALVVTPDISGWWLAILLFGYGVGLGMASAQLTGAVLADVPTVASGQGSATQSTVRQVGSAFGTAVIGALLSVSLGHDLTKQLDTVPNLSAETVDTLATATRESAGGAIAGVRDHDHAGPILDALCRGFTDATRTTLLAAALFLLLGLAAATRIPNSPRATGDAVSR